jgi:hypothetical protein
VLNVINMFPPVFRLRPDYSVRLNQDLMDSATRTGGGSNYGSYSSR